MAYVDSAETVLESLCKPWEFGGHAKDFRVVVQTGVSFDNSYNHCKRIQEDHKICVAEREAYGRNREIKMKMLELLTNIKKILKQRRRFEVIRSINEGNINKSNSLPSIREVLKEVTQNVLKNETNVVDGRYPHYAVSILSCSKARKPKPCPTDIANLKSNYRNSSNNGIQATPSPLLPSVPRKEMLDLDAFDAKLESTFIPEPSSQKKSKKK